MCQPEPEPEPEARPPARKGIDWPAAAMALVASVAFVSALWLRYGPPSVRPAGHPMPGSKPPALVVTDVDTGAARVVPLGGSEGRVVWVTFWSAVAPNHAADLAALEDAWARLRSRARFTMQVAAVDSDRADVVRAARSNARTTLPITLAPPATRRAFGAEGSPLPLHVLIDGQGQVVAVAHGRDEAALSRLADQAERALDDLEPLGRTRFARHDAAAEPVWLRPRGRSATLVRVVRRPGQGRASGVRPTVLPG